MKTIGVIGTAKNTGKTTTLSFLLTGFQLRGLKVCVTGIGYDGEEFDNITLLPKPRLYFEKDTILATSVKCLENTDAKYEVIEETSFITALGKILLVKVTEPGMIVVAGPNGVSSLKQIIQIIKEKTNYDIILVDGSLNRISPMYILDELIFTTGASRSTNTEQLSLEIGVIEKVFSYNKSRHCFNFDENIRVIYKDINMNLYNNILVDDDDFLLLESSLNYKVEKIFIPGLISVESLANNFPKIINRINKPFELIFNSPLQLLLADQFSAILSLVKQFDESSTLVSYRYKPGLSAITINPFYPKLENFQYIPLYLDKEKFYTGMKSNLSIPVFNTMDNEADKIFELL